MLDLKQDEFRIKEDGKPQTIESFSIVKIDALAQQFDGPRRARFAIDLRRSSARRSVRTSACSSSCSTTTTCGAATTCRCASRSSTSSRISSRPADMVAIMYPLTPVTGLTFTRNRASLVSAIEHFQGRTFDYSRATSSRRSTRYYPAQTVEMVRNQVVMTALKGAAISLGGLREGRKSIIFVSEGFTDHPAAAAERSGRLDAGRRATRREARDGSEQRSRGVDRATVDMISDLSLIFTEMNRNNTSIYAVDPRGPGRRSSTTSTRASGSQVDRKHLELALDTLRALADNTDGRAIVNRNDSARACSRSSATPAATT